LPLTASPLLVVVADAVLVVVAVAVSD